MALSLFHQVRAEPSLVHLRDPSSESHGFVVLCSKLCLYRLVALRVPEEVMDVLGGDLEDRGRGGGADSFEGESGRGRINHIEVALLTENQATRKS